MKIHEILLEFEHRSLLYHSVSSGSVVTQILNSGFIKPSEPFEADEELTGETEPVISLSRNQYLRFPSASESVAQFVVDRNALKKAGYKVIPKIGAMMGHKEETEERVYKPIPVKFPYVVELQVDPNLKIPQKIISRTEELGVPIKPWKQINPVNKPVTKPKANSVSSETSYPFNNVSKLFAYGYPPNRKIIYDHYVLIDKIPTQEEADKLYHMLWYRIANHQPIDDLITNPEKFTPRKPEKPVKNWEKGLHYIGSDHKDYDLY